MADSARQFVTQQQAEHVHADLEARLIKAVADFEVDELTEMIDVAEAIRRARRL